MHIRIQQQDLRKIVNIAQRAIATRNPLKILEGILFEARQNQLILSSTDLELSIRTAAGCQVLEEGCIVLQANMIGNIVRKLPNEEVEMKSEGSKVRISCQDSRFELMISDPNEYPALPTVDQSEEIIIENSLLIDAIRGTEFAVSEDETKLAITGIYMKQSEKELVFVALDGYRLAVRKIHSEGPENEVIVPKRAFSELSRILEVDGTCGIRMVSGHILFESGETTLYSRLIDKNYINYEEIIPNNFSTEVRIPRQEFFNALDRASLMASVERANLIKLTFADNQVLIESNSEIGKVRETVPMQKDGEDIRIAFNAKYLMDGIKNLECESLRLFLNGPLSPMIVRPDSDDYMYLVLPVRIGADV